MEQYLYDVFISYRRKGGSEKAQLVKSELILRGIEEKRIFLDTHSLHDGDFEQKIKVAIKQSRSIVVVISKGWFDEIKDTDYWYMEIKEALVEGKQIVPIFFDGTTSYASMNVPGELAALTKKNAVTYHHEYANAAFDKVLSFIGYENWSVPQQSRKKGCLFSIKYKGCLLSVSLIALLVFVIVPITLLHYDDSRPSPTISPYSDDICYSPVDESANVKESAPSSELAAPKPSASNARPNNDTIGENLLGEWQGTNESKRWVSFRFYLDDVIMEEESDSNMSNFNHGFYHINGDKILFKWVKSEDQTAKYKLTSGKLILSFDNGKTIVLTKQRHVNGE